MAIDDPKLDELKQRSHDYAIWFVNTIFGSFAALFLMAGVVAIILGFASLRFGTFALGCVMIVGGSLLFVLLAILRTLKDIRFNSRKLLATQRNATPATDEDNTPYGD